MVCGFGTGAYGDNPPARRENRSPKSQTQLICVMAGIRLRIHRCRMSEDITPINPVICPVCVRPMTLVYTIRRAFGWKQLFSYLKLTPFSNDNAPAMLSRATYRAAANIFLRRGVH